MFCFRDELQDSIDDEEMIEIRVSRSDEDTIMAVEDEDVPDGMGMSKPTPTPSPTISKYNPLLTADVTEVIPELFGVSSVHYNNTINNNSFVLKNKKINTKYELLSFNLFKVIKIII